MICLKNHVQGDSALVKFFADIWGLLNLKCGTTLFVGVKGFVEFEEMKLILSDSS